MFKLGKNVSASLVMGVFLIALVGCQKHEGPAEKAGKEVDKVTEKVGQTIEKAGESIHEATKSDK